MERQKTAREIQTALAMPFAPEDLEWRLQQVNTEKPWGIAVPYVTNRAIQNRLDEVVGPENWCNEYMPWHSSGKKEAQLCGISIYFPDRDKWITKWDGAEDTDIEPVKGGLSDSMKRAAVQWGIGRVLYNIDVVFVDVEQRGKSWVIAKKEQSKLDKAYLDMLQALGLTPAKPIGTQAQLTSETPAEQPEPKAPIPVPKSQSNGVKPKAPSDAGARAGETEAEYEYKVVDVKEQPGMTCTNTRLVLESPEGKRINVFARGKCPDMTLGALLTDTKLATRKQDTVVFYILEDYQMVSLQQAA